uniref:Bifunctional lysine-specific demethylase and histidyl-hydroxylase n=1 Tax=Chromera velia CCMP2878 TaxID=1169474 RepID=A0A0G4FGY1_9ALVE|eukprot:Cvel_16941.t1-p1 / transcript=Cvel_16941.t1 / gene=Cvel_16941 / organism=Chromera_velia_CCMP2878 / gene_product=Bifunctional lysine-specific demethylase and, putative / transcript_product=Bifunctional lysine-specific demethylase and, putative / location=Cvel_scaffold1328:36475-41663(-) / protein_length=520 / sequence_SO=supercontig / SO=protein_coding / is_pseudo=false
MNDDADCFCSTILTPEFFSTYWEERPLLVKAADFPDNPLPSMIDADTMMDILGRIPDQLKIFKKGRAVAPSVSPWLAYLDGASLIVNMADRTHPRLFAFCRELATRFFHHVFAVLYLTPPGTFAVNVHSDDQDTILVQLWGTKAWKVFGPLPGLRLILSDEMAGKSETVPTGAEGPPVLECTLSAGDVLYIPRGHLHCAKTPESSQSLHVTLTVPSSDMNRGAALERTLGEIIRGPLRPQDSMQIAATAAPVSTNSTSRPGGNVLDEEERLLLRRSVLKEDAVGGQGRGERGNNGRESPEYAERIESILTKLRAALTEDNLRASFSAQMQRVNSNQLRQHMRTMQTGPVMVGAGSAVTSRSQIRLDPEIEMTCEAGASEACFEKRGGARLQMRIEPAAADFLRAVRDAGEAGVSVKNLPVSNSDSFERLCLARLFVDKGVLQALSGSGETPNGSNGNGQNGNSDIPWERGSDVDPSPHPPLPSAAAGRRPTRHGGSSQAPPAGGGLPRVGAGVVPDLGRM